MVNRVAVMVTGVGACGVGEGIAKALRMAGRYDVVAVNADRNAPELFEVDKRYVVPRADDPRYLDALLEIASRHDVKVVLPGSEPETVVLSRAASRLATEGVDVLTNPPSVVEIGQDKWLTFEHLAKVGLPTPLTFRPFEDDSFSHRLGYPFILKPRAGHASQDVFLVHSKDEIESFLAHFRRKGTEPVAQEFIPGDDEYTCSTLIGVAGQILGSIGMRRSLMGGFSQRVEVDDFPEATALTERVALSLGARGPINVQCRFWKGQYRVFEINARFSGSAPFRAKVGFNEPDILIQHLLNPDVPHQSSIRTGVVGMRRLEEVIVSWDVYEGVASIGGDPP